jgi:hypothetical protein
MSVGTAEKIRGGDERRGMRRKEKRCSTAQTGLPHFPGLLNRGKTPGRAISATTSVDNLRKERQPVNNRGE